MDGKTWTLSGSFKDLPNNKDIKELKLNNTTNCKYVKLVATETYGNTPGEKNMYFSGSMLNFYEDYLITSLPDDVPIVEDTPTPLHDDVPIVEHEPTTLPDSVPVEPVSPSLEGIFNTIKSEVVNILNKIKEILNVRE